MLAQLGTGGLSGFVARVVTLGLLGFGITVITTPDGPAGAGEFIPAAQAATRAPAPEQESSLDPDAEALPRYDQPKDRTAKKPAKRVKELVGQRTATTKVYELSDGRREAEIASSPVHYRGKDGKWRDIDTRVRASDRRGFSHGVETNAFGTWFGSASDRLVKFQAGGEGVTIGVDGERRTLAPKVDGNTVTYLNAFGDADLVYRVTSSELKEEIVLPAAPEDATFRFSVQAAGVVAKEREDGSIAFYRSSGNGDPVFVMPRPYMTDAKDDASSPYGKAFSDKVTQSVEQHGSQIDVTVKADEKWLNSSDRVYPVVVDPTVKIEPTPTQGQDTMIMSTAPDTNYGADWKLSVGTTGTGVSRSLMKFDLGGVPAGTQLDTAQLKTYYDQVHTTNDYDVPIEARRVTVPWDESTATWSSTNGSYAEVGYNEEVVDNSDTDKVSVWGTWPQSNSGLTQYGINGGYQYNKNATTGEKFTWYPDITEQGDYTVDAHYIAYSDRSTRAPYTVYYSGPGGRQIVNVDQTQGTNGVWKTLGTFPFTAGSGQVTLGDVSDSTKAVIADAVRFKKYGKDTKVAGETSTWHTYSVRSTVQSWLDGTNPNYGFMLKATEETLGRGGPRYEAAEYAYNGETDNRPKLLLTWGRPGVDLAAPTKMHATGAELDWSAYHDTEPGSQDDLLEYQVHRSVYQNFTPSASTLIAPVAPGTTHYTDTSAEPTAADDPDPTGRAYYYMVVAKTKDGELIKSGTQIARLPKAGQIRQIFQGNTTDTTLSSAQPTNGHDVFDGEPWLSVGNNSTTYGTTRSVAKFPDLEQEIPSGSTILDAEYNMWTAHAYGSGASFDVHALNKNFDETATWQNATSTTAWATPGGDFGAAVDNVPSIADEPKWHRWNVGGVVQDWVNGTKPNYGFLVKNHDEAGAQQRFLSLSSEAEEPQLRPKVVVTYIAKTTESTYHAPETPERMIPGDQYTVPVTVTNTTNTTWTSGSDVLSYHWALPDGTDATTSGNRLETALPQDVSPGEVVTVNAAVKTPIQSDEGNKREDFILQWDLLDTSTGQWLSQSESIPPLAQNIVVEDPTSDELGLEKFYQYAGKNTGAGTSALVNQYAGNTVFSYDAFTNPSRGPSTFTRFTYNSMDTSASSMGYGWSLSTSSLTRLGSPLDFHPKGQDWPTEVTLTDGDGTSHKFSLNKHSSADPNDWDYDAPAGVHLFLDKNDAAPDSSRAWVMTKPDRTQFFFDTDGYLQAVADKNGNELLFTYEDRRSNNKPTKILQYITDATGRRTLSLDYYEKGQDYPYYDDAGVRVAGTNLTNPKIIDQVESITDISGRKINLVYTDKGLMTELVDGYGKAEAKTFRFTYDATNTNKNTKLVKVSDPRGNDTSLTYYDAPTDPKDKWRAQILTDRLGGRTTFSYVDPDGQAGSQIETTVTDPEQHSTVYLMDGYGRPTQVTNAKAQVTKLGWDADNNVTRLEEPNGAVSTWAYDPNTGYPLTIADAEANANATAPTTLTYQTTLSGHVADLTGKQTPEGNTWAFGYDSKGNLASVTDPKGTATPDSGDYTSTYTYDGFGQPLTQVDANGNVTTYGDYHATGYPKTITDALDNATGFGYDVRGNVLTVTDAKNHTATYTYDAFSRPLESTTPKDGATTIHTPAPVYDRNDNVTEATAPNGAVSSYAYDAADQMTSATAPKDTPTGPDRTSSYVYDGVGNLVKQTEPKGNLTPTDPTDYLTTFGYDEIYQLTEAFNSQSEKISYAYDSVGNVTTVVDPRKNATTDTGDFTTKYTYDRNHRVTAVTDAAGHTESTAYDLDGNVTSTTDKENNQTLLSYDERGLVTEVKVPHTTDAGATVYHTTRYSYDEVGNRVKTVTPRGVETAEAADFTEELVYDPLNRVVEQRLPYDPADDRYNTADTITYAYDQVGNLTKVSNPPSDGQSVRNDTTYSHFDNGWVKTSTDPWDIVTTYTYDDLGQQTGRTLTSAGGSSSRTMTWDYYPDGKLKSRSDGGVPVGSQVVLVDNSDVQNTETTGVWDTTTTGEGFYGYDYHTHPAGGSDTFTWNLTIPQDGAYEVFVRSPQATATAADYTITHSAGSTTRQVDQTTNPGEWVSLGSYTFTAATDQDITLTSGASGAVAADAVKLVRDNTGDTDTEKKDFGYGYDPNANLTTITDTTPGARVDTYAMTYDGLNRVAKVEEKKNATVVNTTDYTYDPNSNPLTVDHDNQYSAYEYDTRDLASKVTNGKTVSDPDPKVTTFTYTPRGQEAYRVKDNSNTVDSAYTLDGLLAHQVEKKTDGTVVNEHTLTYNANGHRVEDTAKTMNADDPGAYLDRVNTYRYDPRDRLYTVTKADLAGTVLETETYRHDANNNVVSQTVDAATTTYTYDRNRLLKATTGTSTAAYNYDPYGRLNTITTDGTVVASYTYDGFDRTTEQTTTDSTGTHTTAYTYDALDRTTTSTTNAGAPEAETTTYNYLGTSSEVLNEEVAGKVEASYQYSPWGQRLSQTKTNTDGSERSNFYSYNPHTDVEALTDSNGNTKATYGYTAYGKNDTELFTGVDRPDPQNPTKEPENPYRFNAKRYDPATGGYDMGFRDYTPGLNRFTSRDTYNGALNDLNLGTDPWNSNRYAFAGGNPITGIENDGHMVVECGGTCPSPLQGEGQRTPSVEAGASGEIYGPDLDWTLRAATKWAEEQKTAGQQQLWSRGVDPGLDGGTFAAEWGVNPNPQAHDGVNAHPYRTATFNDMMGTLLDSAIAYIIGRSAGGSKPAAPRAAAGAVGGVDMATARFAQKTYGETFSAGGKFAGRTIDDVTGDLRSGALAPKDVPIDVIVRDGNTLILNTRSSQALTRAGVPRSDWFIVNRTGDDFYEDLLDGQLSRNRLDSTGTWSVRSTG